MHLSTPEAVAVVVDIQERLFAHMIAAPRLEKSCVALIAGLRTLEVPILATEQYPKGLGKTLASVHTALAGEATPTVGISYIEKLEFSCYRNQEFRTALTGSGRRQVILLGIEAHVCVLQPSLDLLEQGYEPVVAVDCTSSRRERDAEIAYRRMEQEGVRLGTYESILFELCGVAGTKTFKAISNTVK